LMQKKFTINIYHTVIGLSRQELFWVTTAFPSRQENYTGVALAIPAEH
jgi:hypothetical protein